MNGPAARHHALGFSLVEVALSVVVIAAGLALAAAGYNHVLTQARVSETRALLVGLAKAATALDEETALRVQQAADSAEVLRAICTDGRASAQMGDASAYLWRCSTGVIRCVDAWRAPIRVITVGTMGVALGQRLQLAGGGVVFESAGPDGDFGDENSARRMDNLRSDDPDVVMGP